VDRCQARDLVEEAVRAIVDDSSLSGEPVPTVYESVSDHVRCGLAVALQQVENDLEGARMVWHFAKQCFFSALAVVHHT
jgi:hypothetical protein